MYRNSVIYKTKRLVVILPLLCFVVLGCASGPSDLKGYVIDTDDRERILVVNGISKETAMNTEQIDIEFLDLIDEAYWLSGVDVKKYSKGDYVEVWLDNEIDASFPAQTSVIKIRKIEEDSE